MSLLLPEVQAISNAAKTRETPAGNAPSAAAAALDDGEGLGLSQSQCFCSIGPLQPTSQAAQHLSGCPASGGV